MSGLQKYVDWLRVYSSTLPSQHQHEATGGYNSLPTKLIESMGGPDRRVVLFKTVELLQTRLGSTSWFLNDNLHYFFGVDGIFRPMDGPSTITFPIDITVLASELELLEVLQPPR